MKLFWNNANTLYFYFDKIPPGFGEGVSAWEKPERNREKGLFKSRTLDQSKK